MWGRFGGAPPWKVGNAKRSKGSQLTTCAARSPPRLWCAVRLLRVEARYASHGRLVVIDTRRWWRSACGWLLATAIGTSVSGAGTLDLVRR